MVESLTRKPLTQVPMVECQFRAVNFGVQAVDRELQGAAETVVAACNNIGVDLVGDGIISDIDNFNKIIDSYPGLSGLEAQRLSMFGTMRILLEAQERALIAKYPSLSKIV